METVTEVWLMKFGRKLPTRERLANESLDNRTSHRGVRDKLSLEEGPKLGGELLQKM